MATGRGGRECKTYMRIKFMLPLSITFSETACLGLGVGKADFREKYDQSETWALVREFVIEVLLKN